MSEKVLSISTYTVIFIALLVLTGTTCWVSYLNLGRLNAVVALTIALCKALLVALYFMHLRYSARLTPLVVVTALFWLAILIWLTLSDYLTRALMTSS